MRHGSPLDEILEPRDYLFLIHDVVESLRPVLLSPESGFQSDPTEPVDVLSHIELFHPSLNQIFRVIGLLFCSRTFYAPHNCLGDSRGRVNWRKNRLS